MKLDPDFKARWLDDLRSGKYIKTKKHLRDARGHCCLGVALCTLGVAWNDTAKMVTTTVAGLPVKVPATWLEPLEFDGAKVHNGNELSAAGRELVGLSIKAHDDLVVFNDNNDTWDKVIAYIESEL